MLGKILFIAVLSLSLEEGCEKGHGGRPEKRPPQFEEAEIESMCSVGPVFAVVAHNPHQSKGKPTDIVGKAWLTCTQAITFARFEVKIQRQIDAGRWIDEEPQLRGECVYPTLAAGEKKVCQASAKCPADRPTTKFRTAARAEGVHEGKPAGMTVWKPSREVLVPCK